MPQLAALFLAGAALLAPRDASAAAQKPAIVLPADPTRIERFAGAELARCLEQSLGWKAAVVPAGRPVKAAPLFRVGTMETPSRLGVALPAAVAERAGALADEGVCVHAAGSEVFLVGKGKRGPLNAVHTFLEEVVGCHWPEPGQEFVPRLATLNWQRVSILSSPAFRYRGIAIHGRCSPEWFLEIVDWLAKNRMNAFQVFPGHYEQLRPKALDALLDRGLFPNIGGHSREFFFPAHEHFKTHPEYFALVKGKRVADTQICYSNLESVPAYAGSVLAYLKKRPEIGMASLWPSDGYGFCECERCKAGHVTDVILRYTNAVAARVLPELPEAKFEFLSYIHYTVPPRDVAPLPEVVPTYCEYWSRSQFHPITEERSGNRKCRQELNGWITASKEVTLFSYYGDDCIKRYVYNPLMEMILTDLRYYRKARLAGHFVLLTNPESWWSNAPPLYAYARAAWEPGGAAAQVEREYYRSLYGPAAVAMQAHAAACRALFDLKTAQGVTGEDVVWGMHFPNFDPKKDAETRRQGAEAAARIRAALAQALETRPRPWVAERIRKFEAAADYVGLLFEIVCQTHKTRLDNTPEAKQQLYELTERGLALEVVAQDDRLGYRSARNVLVDVSRKVAGKEPSFIPTDPAALKLFKERGIWRWGTTDIEPSDRQHPRRVVIEVTDRVKAAGTYEVVWDYLDGADGLAILSTGLYTTDAPDAKPEDLKPLAVDEHDGFTGGGDSKNVYTLALSAYEKGRRYFVVGQVYDERDFDTFGQVLFGPKP